MNGDLTLSMEIDRLSGVRVCRPAHNSNETERFITTGSAKLAHVVERFFCAIIYAGGSSNWLKRLGAIFIRSWSWIRGSVHESAQQGNLGSSPSPSPLFYRETINIGRLSVMRRTALLRGQKSHWTLGVQTPLVKAAVARF